VITEEVDGQQVVCRNATHDRLAVFSTFRNANTSITSMRFGNQIAKDEIPPEPDRRMFCVSYLFDCLMEIPVINELSTRGTWVMTPQYHLISPMTYPTDINLPGYVYMISSEEGEIVQGAHNPKVYIDQDALKYALSQFHPDPDEHPDLCAKVFVNSFHYNELMQVQCDIINNRKISDNFKLTPLFDKIVPAGLDIPIWNEGIDET